MSYATSSDGVRIYYTSAGQGEPLILSHGMTHTWESWEDLGYIDALKSNFQLILIDSRGHGQSDKPHGSAAYSMTQQVDDVMAVANDFGIDRFHFFGYSLGALIGFQLAVTAGERVQSLVAYGGDPYAPFPEYRAGVGRDIEILHQGMKTWVDLMDDIGVFSQYPNAEARKGRLLSADADALAAAITASTENPGVGDALARITMPTLLIVGQHEGCNDVARKAAQELPLADFVSVAGLRHSMVHAKIILPYVSAFFERFGVLDSQQRSR